MRNEYYGIGRKAFVDNEEELKRCKRWEGGE
jgi:hypothetical protein